MPEHMRGYTIVELMVTIVIVSVLAASVGAFIVKLLTLQENEREEAYVREKLADICGAYADYLSVGSSVVTNPTNQTLMVAYRQEAGGVSLETGVVSHVVSLISSLDPTNGMLGLKIYGLETGTNILKLSRTVDGSASLMPLAGDMVSCKISPLNAVGGDSALVVLRVAARHRVKTGHGKYETKTTIVERIARLWNHE